MYAPVLKATSNQLQLAMFLQGKAMKIEIVSTALASDLLEGAGTGACPEGATMDLLKPQICPPGEGLQQSWKNAVPCARAATWMAEG